MESVLRFVNLTATGLLAGSLGFGRSPLVPGWQGELPPTKMFESAGREIPYLDSIGPIAVASSLALTVGSRSRPILGKSLDLLATAAAAGVIVMTTLGTVRINRKLDGVHPLDYENESSYSLARTWGRAHVTRRVLGIGSFLCAAAASVIRPNHSSKR